MVNLYHICLSFSSKFQASWPVFHCCHVEISRHFKNVPYFCFNCILSLVFFPGLDVCETSLMVYLPLYLKVTPPNGGFINIYPDMGSEIAILLLTLLSLPLSPSYFSPQMWLLLQHRRATAQPWEDLCLCLKPGRDGNFFCSSRELIICSAQALTSVVLYLCAPFWHCIIQSIWHRAGENENSRKLIPQTVNFISKSALPNLVWKGGGFFFYSVLLTELCTYFINLKIK